MALLAGLMLAAGCRTPSQWSERTQEADLKRRAAAQAHFAAGVIQALNEDASAAYDEFFLAAKCDPQDAELLLEVSNRLIEGRQYPRALDVLVMASELPNPPDVLFIRLGFVYAQLGQTQKSIDATSRAVAKMPRFLPVRQNLYINYLKNGQPDAALKVLNDAAAEPGTDAEFLINLAELYINHGRQFPEQRAQVSGRALELLNRARKMTPLDVALYLKLADGFALLGDVDGAVKIYNELITRGDPSPPFRDILRAKLVDVYLRNNDRAHASEQLQAILRETPGNASALYFMGSIAFEDKRWADAIDYYQRALLFNPGFEQARYDLASAQLAAGRDADAVKTMQETLKQFPGKFAGEYLLGMAYHAQKNYPEALNRLIAAEAIGRAGETNRLNTTLYFQLGATSERAGDRVAAAKYFEKAIELAPDNSDALNYLGYMWAEKGENLKQAKQLIERALKIEPDSAAYLDSLGWVYYQMGKPREAVDYLLKAVAATKDEPDATIHDHLGDAYAALKDMDKARESWAKSLSIEPSDAVKKKLDDSKTP